MEGRLTKHDHWIINSQKKSNLSQRKKTKVVWSPAHIYLPRQGKNVEESSYKEGVLTSGGRYIRNYRRKKRGSSKGLNFPNKVAGVTDCVRRKVAVEVETCVPLFRVQHTTTWQAACRNSLLRTLLYYMGTFFSGISMHHLKCRCHGIISKHCMNVTSALASQLESAHSVSSL